MLGAFLNFFIWLESIHDKLDLVLVTLEEIQTKSTTQDQIIMATFKQLLDAQKKSADAILEFIKSESSEILAQLELGKKEASQAGAEAAFDEAIASLGSFTSSIGDAIQGMVPGMKTPEVATPPVTVDAPAPASVEVEVPALPVEVPVTIVETETGVEGGLAIDIEVK